MSPSDQSPPGSTSADPKREFKGIWICAAIWEDDDLTLAERCLIAEVDSLCGRDKACYASNAFLAKRLRLSDLHMNGMLSDLTRWGYLIRLAFTGRQTLRCVHPMFSSDAETVHELLRQYGVEPPKGRPHKDAKALEKSAKSSLGIKPKAGRVGIKPKAALTHTAMQPEDIAQPEILKTENKERTMMTAPAAVTRSSSSFSFVSDRSEEEPTGELSREDHDELSGYAYEFEITERQSNQVVRYAKLKGMGYVRQMVAAARADIENLATAHPNHSPNKARSLMAALRDNWDPPKPATKKPTHRKPPGLKLEPEPSPNPLTSEQQRELEAAHRALLDSLRNPSNSPKVQAKTSAAEARYERMQRRWDEASVEERNGWIAQGDPIVRKYFRADGPLPMRSLWSAVIPDPDETSQTQGRTPQTATALLSPQQPEETAA